MLIALCINKIQETGIWGEKYSLSSQFRLISVFLPSSSQTVEKMKLILILSAVLLNFNLEVQGKFEVQYQWKSLSFSKLDSRANFNSTHPVPFGIAKHGNRMFIGMARRAPGVPVTLGYYNLNANFQDPEIIAYPSMQANTVNVSIKNCEIFQMKVEKNMKFSVHLFWPLNLTAIMRLISKSNPNVFIFVYFHRKSRKVFPMLTSSCRFIDPEWTNATDVRKSVKIASKKLR